MADLQSKRFLQDFGIFQFWDYSPMIRDSRTIHRSRIISRLWSSSRFEMNGTDRFRSVDPCLWWWKWYMVSHWKMKCLRQNNVASCQMVFVHKNENSHNFQLNDLLCQVDMDDLLNFWNFLEWFCLVKNSLVLDIKWCQ